MSIEEMIDNIKEGQIARGMYQKAVWYVTLFNDELYYCDKYGNRIKKAMVSYWNVQAEWEIL